MKHKQCGVEKTLKIISSKWTMRIIHTLFNGKKRFGELHKELDGISTKTLSARLKELEKEKILTRKVFIKAPLHVEYSLAEQGNSLSDIFKQMAHWGETHR